MLYDPKWDGGTTPSLQGFIAWLELQPAGAEYVYEQCSTCAIGNYAQSIGTRYAEIVMNMPGMLPEWNSAITAPLPRTYGAALDRARALVRT